MKINKTKDISDYTYSSAYLNRLDYFSNLETCKEMFIDYIMGKRMFYFAFNKKNKVKPNTLMDYLNKLETFIGVKKSKFKLYEDSKYFIIKVSYDSKWNLNQITRSLLLESIRSKLSGKYTKSIPNRLIRALNKFGFNYLKRARYNEDYHFLCNRVNRLIGKDFKINSKKLYEDSQTTLFNKKFLKA